MADRRHIQELAVRTVVAMTAGSVGLAGPDAAAVATSLTPMAEEALSTVIRSVSSRRRDHASEVLADAAEAAGVMTDEDFAAFIQEAVSDERKQELLARSLAIAQDVASRDKRKMIGKVIAAALEDNGTQVDQEMIVLRVVNDLDAPHFKLLTILAEKDFPVRKSDGPPPESVQSDWGPVALAGVDRGLREAVPVLLFDLERRGLIEPSGQRELDLGRATLIETLYKITNFGLQVYNLLSGRQIPINAPIFFEPANRADL